MSHSFQRTITFLNLSLPPLFLLHCPAISIARHNPLIVRASAPCHVTNTHTTSHHKRIELLARKLSTDLIEASSVTAEPQSSELHLAALLTD